VTLNPETAEIFTQETVPVAGQDGEILERYILPILVPRHRSGHQTGKSGQQVVIGVSTSFWCGVVNCRLQRIDGRYDSASGDEVYTRAGQPREVEQSAELGASHNGEPDSFFDRRRGAEM